MCTYLKGCYFVCTRCFKQRSNVWSMEQSEPTPLATPGNVSEMQILGAHPRPAGPEMLVSPASVLLQAFQVILMHIKPL